MAIWWTAFLRLTLRTEQVTSRELLFGSLEWFIMKHFICKEHFLIMYFSLKSGLDKCASFPFFKTTHFLIPELKGKEVLSTKESVMWSLLHFFGERFQ